MPKGYFKNGKKFIPPNRKGKDSNLWKGGRPKCPDCGKILDYRSKYCYNHNAKRRSKKFYEDFHKKSAKSRTGMMPSNLMNGGKFCNVKRGWYRINGKRMFFRSMWEVNYALYLDFLIKNNAIKKWTYEEDVFIFHKIQFGTRSYRPDFKIIRNDGRIEYHEIKGWMDDRSKTKIRRMAKYYPNIKLIIIDEACYKDIKNKVGKIIGFY